MPSIAAYVNEILAEPMYGSDYIKRIDQRVDAFNAAQLTGINNHVLKTAKTAKFHVWKSANEEVISKISGTLKVRVEAQQKIINEREAIKLLKRQKEQKKLAKKAEGARVLRDILKSALEKAKVEVKAEEQIRQTMEKTEISHKVFEMEVKKWKYLRYLLVGFLTFFIVPCIVVSQWYILVPILFFVTGVTCYLAYRFHMMTIILPYDMTQDELDTKISERQIKLKGEALTILQEKELKFQEMVLRDKIERRIGRLRRKREALQKAKIEFEKRKAWEEQQIQMAQEVRFEEEARRKLEEEESSDEEESEKEHSNKNIEPPATDIDCPYKFYLAGLNISPGKDLVEWNKPIYGTISLSMHDHIVLHKTSLKPLIGASTSYNYDEFESVGKHHSDAEGKHEGSAPIHHNSNGSGSSEQRHHHHFHEGLVLHLQAQESIVIKVFKTAKYEKIIILGEVRITANMIRQAALDRVNRELLNHPFKGRLDPWNGDITLECPLVWTTNNSCPRGSIDVFGYDHEVYRYYLEKIASIEQIISTVQTTSALIYDTDAGPETIALQTGDSDQPGGILDATASQPIRLVRLDVKNIAESFIFSCQSLFSSDGLRYRLFMSLEGNDELLLFGHGEPIVLEKSTRFQDVTFTISEFSSYELLLSSELLLRFRLYLLPLSTGDFEANFVKALTEDTDIRTNGRLKIISDQLTLIGECELFGDEILYKFLDSTITGIQVEKESKFTTGCTAALTRKQDIEEGPVESKVPEPIMSRQRQFNLVLEEGNPATVSASISIVMEKLSELIFISDLL